MEEIVLWIRTFGILLILVLFYGLYILNEHLKRKNELRKIKEIETQKTFRQELQQATKEIERD